MIYARKSISTVLYGLFFLALCSECLAIDNPDAPDVVAEFETRAQIFETNIENQISTSDIKRTYLEYEKSLDKELNQAYSALMKHVSSKSRKNLMASQKRWIQFRDAEFLFIDNNWTLETFGSSYAISRGASRTTILRNRVVELLYYLRNY